MTQPTKTTLTITTTVSLIGSIYYFLPNFPHLFASDDARLSVAFVLLIVFIVAFFTAVQLTPDRLDICPHCDMQLRPKIKRASRYKL